MSEVLEDCRVSPLTFSSILRLSPSTWSAVTSQGPSGAQPSPDLPIIHWLVRLWRSRAVVAGGVAEDVVRRVLLADVARLPADDDDELGLVVELLGRLLRDGDRAAMMVQHRVELVEEDRHRRHRVAGLGRVLAVVQADADDLLGIGHAGAELGRVLRHEEALTTRHPRLVDEPGECRHVALALEHGVDGRRRAFAQLRFGLDDVEDAALGADAEAVFAALAERREGHALRQLLRAGARSAGPGRGRRRKAAKARCRRSAGKRRGLEEGPAIVLHGFLPSGPDTAPAFRAG